MDTEGWPVPTGLSAQGRKAAHVLRSFFKDEQLEYHGGGGKFYTPKQWADRGESYGLSALLIVTHDGGEHARAFNLDYEDYATFERLNSKLAENGLWMEACTCWYTAIYPL